MQYFKFFIHLLVLVYNSCNVDFFGLGFGFMDFMLGAILLILIIQFLKNGMGNSLGGSLSMSSLGLMKDSFEQDNTEREINVSNTTYKKNYNTNYFFHVNNGRNQRLENRSTKQISYSDRKEE